MFRLSLFCLVLCTGWYYAASSPVYTIDYEPEYKNVKEDLNLHLHILPATWSDAAVRCQLEGSVLASPSTSVMAQAMFNAMDEHEIPNVFIGATDLFSKGEFRSLDGVDLANNLKWVVGEPDNADDSENCLALTNNGKLADVSCRTAMPYFCRKITHDCPKKETNDKTYNFYDTIDINSDNDVLSAAAKPCEGNGYNWEPRTGSCYKFHKEAKPWRSALATCHTEGGHLAIINSDTESSVLRDMFEQIPGYEITGTDMLYHATDYALIGFVDWEANGDRITIFGETLAEAGFDKWLPGEPDHLGVENCGSIHRDGYLNDIACTRKFAFICEITP